MLNNNDLKKIWQCNKLVILSVSQVIFANMRYKKSVRTFVEKIGK